MKIYAIATKTRVCYGHGDYGEELKIEMVDAYHAVGKWNPVFFNRDTAQAFLDNLRCNHDKKIVKIDLIEK